MKKLNFVNFSAKNTGIFIWRAALIFITLVVSFSLVEPGASQAFAVTAANKTFKTDYKLAPLESAKQAIAPGLTQQPGGPLELPKVDNPRGHKYEEPTKRTPFTSTYVNNDGTRSLEYSTEQQNYLETKTWKR